MAKTSPTQRSLKHLRDQGYTAAVVEKWNPHAHIRQDLFGVIDIVAMRADVGILAVQTTTMGNVPARKLKAMGEPRLKVWLESGGLFTLHGWSMRGKKGKRKLWEIRTEEVTLQSYADLKAFAEACSFKGSDLPRAETVEKRISREEAAL